MKLCTLLLAASTALAAAQAASAQAHAASGPVPAVAPDTPGMIEALRPGATRGFRNLLVRQRDDAPVADANAAAVTAAAPASAAAAGAGAEAAQPPATAPSLSLLIQFDSNSSRVRPESGPVLGNLVAAMLSPELKGNRFAIEGHTDAVGPAARNQTLSQERAEEVRLYLVALGVHPSRLKAVGRGASDPANPLNPAAAENRRVRVVTLE